MAGRWVGDFKLKCLERRKFSAGGCNGMEIQRCQTWNLQRCFRAKSECGIDAETKIGTNQLINLMLVLVMQLVLTLTTNLQLADVILALLVIRWNFNLMTFMNNFFFARRPIGSCNLVLFVHHRLMRGENLYMILELGRSPLCTVKRETSWWKLWQKRFGSWTKINRQNKKQGRGPPGTQAPPGQVPGDTAKEQTAKPQHDPIFNS